MRALTADVVVWLAQSTVGTVGCHAGDKKRNTTQHHNQLKGNSLTYFQ